MFRWREKERKWKKKVLNRNDEERERRGEG